MNDKSLRFVQQLIEKTEKGLIQWKPAIEDGQFMTLLGNGELAFVVQVKGDLRKLLLLDDHQETILEEEIQDDEFLQISKNALEAERYQRETGNKPRAHVHPEAQLALLYDEIGRLQELARSKALKVDQRLVQAEELLSSLR